jgi:hypothetical protein
MTYVGGAAAGRPGPTHIKLDFINFKDRSKGIS